MNGTNVLQCWCEQLLCRWCANEYIGMCPELPAAWIQRLEDHGPLRQTTMGQGAESEVPEDLLI